MDPKIGSMIPKDRSTKVDNYWIGIHDPIGSHVKARRQILDAIGSLGSILKWILNPVDGSFMELMMSDQ